MATITHAKASGLPADDGDASKVQPTDWYAGHVLTDISGLSAFIGCRAYNQTAVQAVAASTAVPVNLLTEEFDSDGFHEGVTNPSRMTIPAGLSGKYLVAGTVRWPSGGTGTQRNITITKNGNIQPGGMAFRQPTSNPQTTETTIVLDLAAGDYVQMVAFQDTSGSVNIGGTNPYEASSLFVVKLDSGKVGSGIGARAITSGSTALTSSVDTALPLAGTDDFDTDGFHDPASNNTRLTIPAGLGGLYAIGGFVAFTASTTGDRYAHIRKGGSTALAYQRQVALDAAGNATIVNVSTIAQLVAGDYVELVVLADTGSISATSGAFWIARLDSGTSTYSGAAWGSGTAFPSGPTTNQRFTRTDLTPSDYFYDGTRWRSVQVFKTQMLPRLDVSLGYSGELSRQITASTGNSRAIAPSVIGGSDIYLVNYKVVFNVQSGGTALGASHKWVCVMQWLDVTQTGGNIGTVATIDSGSSGTNNPWRTLSTGINSIQPAGALWYQTSWTKTGTPGALVFAEEFTYQVIAT